VCPSSRLWGGVLDCDSQFTHPESTIVRRTPALTLYKRVFLPLSPHTCILCPIFPPGRSLCGRPRSSLHLLEEGHNHLIVHFAYLCHMIGEEFVFFSFLYFKLFELVVEVTFNNRSAVTHRKVNLLKLPLWKSRFERKDDAFVLLICSCYFPLSEPFIPVC